MNKHQFRSLLGVIGGIFFMAGDCLIYCYKGNIGAEIDPLWIDVSMWRFVISAIFGFIGMSLMWKCLKHMESDHYVKYFV